jgi:hypothetical protein
MIGIDASAAIQVVAGLIAAALYAAAYLSFVRLLRFPRNWVTLGPSAVGTTGLLVALTLAWVSLSGHGLDTVGLAVSAAFIIVIFIIVAAPAIAFHPANRGVEFLAKHAGHAGLWLLAPALVAGLALPNIELQAMLAAAMVIEISWSLRQHLAGRRRQLHPFNDNDLAVLEAQAGGDLVAFRRRHGIRELVLSGNNVSWRGCGKNTPPCPFNLYVNRLGLNTAPCCREHMREISHYVAACLRDIGAVHWLEGGSLLGAVREGGELLEWEDDMDISVLLDAEMSWDRLSAGLTERCTRDGFFIDLFERESLITISFDTPKLWPFRWERYRLRGEIRVDVALYRQAISHGDPVLERQSYKGDMPATESGGYGVPQEIVLPTSTIDFLGSTFDCPHKPEEYLRVLYGDFEDVEYTYVNAAAAETRRQADMAK